MLERMQVTFKISETAANVLAIVFTTHPRSLAH